MKLSAEPVLLLYLVCMLKGMCERLLSINLQENIAEFVALEIQLLNIFQLPPTLPAPHTKQTHKVKLGCLNASEVTEDLSFTVQLQKAWQDILRILR